MAYRVLHDRYGVLLELSKRPGRETLMARDWQTNNLVVIKLLKFSSELEWDDFKLFEREAQTLKNLSHPAIPQYLDYFEFETPQCKGFALVQTYIDAPSLSQYRQSGRTFSEDEITEIAEQLLETLNYLHDRYPPIIHRDIKPSNILLGDRTAHSVGQVYLVDFGSVQNVAATEGGTFTVVGTYGYMPPEQFGGRGVPASDLYSLGATLIYLLTGRHPADLPQRNLKIEFAKVVKLSPTSERWLNQMLDPSLDGRFNSAKIALQRLHKNTQANEIKFFESNINSSTILHRDEISISQRNNTLKLVIPSNKLEGSKYNINKISSLILYSFTIVYLLLLLLGTVNSFFYTLSVRLLSFFLLGILIYSFDAPMKVEFNFTSEKVYLEYIFLGFKIHQQNLKNNDILKIERKRLFFEKRSTAANRKGDDMHESIVVWFGTTPYTLTNLTKAQADRIGSELSNWFNLPIYLIL